jgi:SAM-dependent methyltransferase
VSAYSARELAKIRRSRRHPRLAQFDYVHLRVLVRDLAAALRRLAAPGARVLDVYCGSRPYDDLLPESAEVVGFDVEGNPYGTADVVSDDFLPFPDAEFDLVLCIQAFDFVPDPERAVAEFRRVLRPGGRVLVTVPLAWEYDRTQLVRRYSGPELAELFRGWEDVQVAENGGVAVAWTTLTALLLRIAQRRLGRPAVLRWLVWPVFTFCYVATNVAGLGLHALEQRFARGDHVLPMNLMLTARAAGP